MEKSIAAGMGAATAFVVASLGYSIDRKATSTRKQRSWLVSTARLLLLEAVFGAAVCLAVIVAIAIGPLEHIYLSALAGTTLFVAGLFGCLFGALFWMRATKRAATESPGVQIQRTVAESSSVITSIGGRLKGGLPRLN
jgi:Na+/proline symporter